MIPPRRRYPTPKEKAAILARQNNLCGCGCGTPLDGRPVEYDHELSLWIRGDNSTENFRALTVACHKAKTAKDAKDRAKIKRILKKAAGETKRKKKINGPGFSRRWRKKLNGKTELRAGAARMG